MTQAAESTTHHRACKVCALPLTRATNLRTDEITYLHSRSWEIQDHEPEPVALDQVQRIYICDFCTSVPVRYLYTGPRMLIESGQTNSDFGNTYSVCQGCDTLVQNRQLDKLYDRIIRLSPPVGMFDGTIPEHVVREHLDAMQGQFIRSITAREWAPRPAPPPRHFAIAAAIMPKVRDRLARFCRDVLPSILVNNTEDPFNLPGEDLGVPQRQVQVAGTTPQVAATFSTRLHDALLAPSCQLFWVSKTFTQIAIHAGRTLPDLDLKPEQLPAEHGLLIWDAPIYAESAADGREVPIIACTWTPVRDGVWVTLYTNTEHVSLQHDPTTMRQILGWLQPAGTGTFFPTTGETLRLQDAGAESLTRTILATWFLIQQPGVAEETQTLPDKATQRSYGRAGRPRPAVRLIDLRRPPRKARERDGDGTAPARVWRHRRLVTGHWRDQPYGPKRGLRRRIFISPYIAGDETLPFRVNDDSVVNLLR